MRTHSHFSLGISLRKLFFAFAMLAAFSGQASHLLGGDITWQCKGNGKFIFRLTLYRDCAGIGMDTTAKMLQAPISPSILCSFIRKDVVLTSCDTLPCNYSNPIPGIVERYIFESGEVAITSSFPAGGFTVSFTECCRAAGIINLDNSPSQNFYISSTMYPYTPPASTNPSWPYPCYDNSPQFINPLPTLLCVNKGNIITNAALDPDGDSLWYELSSSKLHSTVPSAYAPGYSFSAPLPDTSENPQNIFSYTNNPGAAYSFSLTQGTFSLSQTIYSYRNGQLISKVMREGTIAITSCIDTAQCSGKIPGPTKITAQWSQPSDSLLPFIPLVPDSSYVRFVRYAPATIGDTVRFSLNGFDADSLPNCTPETISLSAFGLFLDTSGICQAGVNCASIISNNPNNGFTNQLNNTVSFEWPITTCSPGLDGWQTFYFDFSTNTCPYPSLTRAEVKVRVQTNLLSTLPDFDQATSFITPPGDVNLTWSRYEDTASFISYLIWHRYKNGAPYIILPVYDVLDTSYMFSMLPGGKHTFWVRATDQCNQKIDSLQQFDTTLSRVDFISTLNDTENALPSLAVYPNPMDDFVQISSPALKGEVHVFVFDVTGTAVIRQTFYDVRNSIVLGTATLPKGFYRLQIKQGSRTSTVKMVK